MITVTDRPEPICSRGGSSDGSDKSIMSAFFAKKIVLNNDDKIKKIDNILIQVAIKHIQKEQSFNFTRIWFPPRTVLSLPVRSLALKNVFFVVHLKMSNEDQGIGYPVLKHVGVDTRTILSTLEIFWTESPAKM